MSPETLSPEDEAEIAAFEALTLDAQMLFGLWFGLGRTESYTVRHGLKELKPTARTQAALDLLLERGFISLTREEDAAKVYRPLKEAEAAFAWVRHHMENDAAFRDNAAGWRLMEPIG